MQQLLEALFILAQGFIHQAAVGHELAQSLYGKRGGRGERVDDALAVAVVGNQAGVTKDGEVAGDGVLGQMQDRLQVANAGAADAEEVEEAEAGRLSGGFEDAGEV
ncbi:MAG TPA: hypothetical protein VGA39_02595 [Candidatus Acidoferrales bacterium]